MSDFPGIVTHVRVDTRPARRELADFTRSLSQVRSGLGDITRQAAGFGLAMVGLRGMDQIFHTLSRSVIGLNAQLETAELQFEVLLGSAQQARTHVKSLFDFAAATPFATEPVIRASRALLNFGIGANESEVALRRVGDAAAIVAEPIQDVAYWSGRLRDSLTNKTPWIDAITSLTRMAVVSGALRGRLEAMEQSGASAGQMIDELHRAMQRTTGGMAKLAGTWTGLMTTITDSIEHAQARGFKPLFDALKEMATATAKFVQTDEFGEWAKRTSYQLTGLISRMKDFTATLLALPTQAKRLEPLEDARSILQSRVHALEDRSALAKVSPYFSIFGVDDYDAQLAAARAALAKMDADIEAFNKASQFNVTGGLGTKPYGPPSPPRTPGSAPVIGGGMTPDEVTKALTALIEQLRILGMSDYDLAIRKLVEPFDLAPEAIRKVVEGLAQVVVQQQALEKDKQAAMDDFLLTQGAELAEYEGITKAVEDLATARMKGLSIRELEAQALDDFLRTLGPSELVEYEGLTAAVHDLAVARTKAVPSIEREREELKILTAELTYGKDAALEARAALDLFGRSLDKLSDQERAQVRELAGIRREARLVQETGDALRDIFGAVGGAFERLAEGIILGTRDLKSAFRDLAQSIIVAFAQRVIRQALKPLMDAMSQVAMQLLSLMTGSGGGVSLAGAGSGGGLTGLASGAGGALTLAGLAGLGLQGYGSITGNPQLSMYGGGASSLYNAARLANIYGPTWAGGNAGFGANATGAAALGTWGAGAGLLGGVLSLIGGATGNPKLSTAGTLVSIGGTGLGLAGITSGLGAPVVAGGVTAAGSTAGAALGGTTAGVGAAGGGAAGTAGLGAAGVAGIAAAAVVAIMGIINTITQDWKRLSEGQKIGASGGLGAAFGVNSGIAKAWPWVDPAGSWIGGMIGSFFGKPDIPHRVREAREVSRTLGYAGGAMSDFAGARSLGDLYDKLVAYGSGTTGGTSPIALMPFFRNPTEFTPAGPGGFTLQQMGQTALLGGANPQYPTISRSQFISAAGGGNFGNLMGFNIQAGVTPGSLGAGNTALTQTVVAQVEQINALTAEFNKLLNSILSDIIQPAAVQTLGQQLTANTGQFHKFLSTITGEMDAQIKSANLTLMGLTDPVEIAQQIEKIRGLIQERYQEETRLVQLFVSDLQTAADAWADLATAVRAQIEDLTASDLGPTNPSVLLAQARENYTAAMAGFVAQPGAESGALVSQRVPELLEAAARMFDRPSQEYQAIFDEMIAALQQVETFAQDQETVFRTAVTEALGGVVTNTGLTTTQITALQGLTSVEFNALRGLTSGEFGALQGLTSTEFDSLRNLTSEQAQTMQGLTAEQMALIAGVQSASTLTAGQAGLTATQIGVLQGLTSSEFNTLRGLSSSESELLRSLTSEEFTALRGLSSDEGELLRSLTSEEFTALRGLSSDEAALLRDLTDTGFTSLGNFSQSQLASLAQIKTVEDLIAFNAAQQNEKLAALHLTAANTLTALGYSVAGANLSDDILAMIAQQQAAVALLATPVAPNEAITLLTGIRQGAQDTAAISAQILASIGSPGSGFGIDNQHGLAYVPYDNYRTRLHKGERVLTAEENRTFSLDQFAVASRAGPAVEISINFGPGAISTGAAGTRATAEELVDEIEAALRARIEYGALGFAVVERARRT